MSYPNFLRELPMSLIEYLPQALATAAIILRHVTAPRLPKVAPVAPPPLRTQRQLCSAPVCTFAVRAEAA